LFLETEVKFVKFLDKIQRYLYPPALIVSVRLPPVPGVDLPPSLMVY
jgi:hypothetical protein